MGYPKENGHPFLALRFSAGALVLFSFFAAANLVGCSDSSDSSPDAQSPPPLGVEVAIESGLIRGHDHPESLVWEWLGVPFAKPPIGDLRWRAPQQMDAWEGVRETTNFGNACPQPEGASVIGDEDCLHLNLWRPRSDERDLPVYVWVHGGGNKLQSNSVSRLQGDRLAEQANVVVVSIQFRLGALGWLYYEPLHTGDPLDDSGNYGLLDIIRSLEWVQTNIEAFGGDPANVTVAGNSSGADNILSLLLSERASGLFRKAISHGGIPGSVSPEEGSKLSELLFENLNVSLDNPLTDPSDQEIAEFMRERTAAQIIELSPDLGVIWAFADGNVVASEGAASFSEGKQINKVPLILGSDRDEFKFYTVLLNGYPDVSEEARQAIGRYGSDLWRVVAVDQLATGLSKAPDQPDIYAYRFNWGSPDESGQSPLPGDYGQRLGAHHALEVGFVLGNWEEWVQPELSNIFFTEENEAGRKNLSEAIIKYVAAFIHSDNPNGDNLPVWEPFSTDGAFKAIEFDVNLQDSRPRITVDQEIYSVDTVLADLEENVDEPARSEARKEILTLIELWDY